jgi:urocanate hydratase
MMDNARWIGKAAENRMVVGSQARILYADAAGRERIALAFNEAIRDGRVLGPIVLGRDHHDVSGTDSPYRETANIHDGSNLTADMAVHNVIGDAFRGATWVSLHNGGGVGWGEVVTYGELAGMAGRPRAARAVGSAMRDNPLPFVIPCHRVVAAGGRIGGYGGGRNAVALKRRLLEREGVTGLR